MKKIIIMAIAAAMVTLTSCSNKNNTNAENAENTEAGIGAETIEAQADSIAGTLDTLLQNKDEKGLKATILRVQQVYADLVASGKLEEAKTYASKIQEFLNEHADGLSTLTSDNATITSLINTVKSLPTNAETTAEEAAAAVKTDAKTLKESVKTTTDEALNTVKEEAAAKADKAKDEVSKKVEEKKKEAADKAAEAADKATKKAMEKLGI